MMRVSQRCIHRLWLNGTVFLLVLFFAVACAPSTTYPTLPGQQLWKQGVSSFLFGTNDIYEWSSQNIQTEPSIQVDLRRAGFTLLRSFFPDDASDTVIEQNLRVIENIRAQCLGVITNIFDASFDTHLVRYLGHRCLLYEFGNESDYNNISVASYLKQWNTLIPALRRINPAAKFIGPVTYNDQGFGGGYMRAFLKGVKKSGVLPDAVSFHWYPCSYDLEKRCLAKASSYAKVARGVYAMVQSILGKALPVGISEWNFDGNNPPPGYGDDADFITKFTIDALHSMAQADVAFACQFDAASYAGYGHLDMFQVDTAQPKPQFYALKKLIQHYRT